MKLFEQVVDNSKLHPKFKLLMSGDEFFGLRKILEEWSENYYDKDGKFVKEFQSTYHSSFWELYLSELFRLMGLEQINKYSRPDFILNYKKKVLIEAVVANIKQDGRSEVTRKMEDILDAVTPIHGDKNYEVIINEAITRYSNSINSKLDKYNSGYTHCDWVNDVDPYVIALASFDQISYGREFIYPLLALLYGDYYNPKLDRFDKKQTILKPGTNSEIMLSIFEQDEYKSISAVMFSCTLTVGKLTSLAISKGYYTSNINSVINIYFTSEMPRFKFQVVTSDNPESIADGLIIFHNPNARNKLDLDMFNFEEITQISYDFLNKKILSSQNNGTLHSRIDIPTFQNIAYIQGLLRDLYIDFNGSLNKSENLHSTKSKKRSK